MVIYEGTLNEIAIHVEHPVEMRSFIVIPTDVMIFVDLYKGDIEVVVFRTQRAYEKFIQSPTELNGDSSSPIPAPYLPYNALLRTIMK